MRSKKDMMCSCGKRKGACNCKGYAYGSNKVKGYYNGSLYAEATPQQEQEIMAMAPGVRLAAAPLQPNAEQQTVQEVGGIVMPELAEGLVQGVTKKSSEEAGKAVAKEAGKAVAKEAGKEAVKSAASAGTSAATAGVADLGLALLDDGQIDEGEATQAAFTAGGAALGSVIPGIGTAIGGALGSLVGGVVGGGSEAPAPKAGPLTPQKKTAQPKIDSTTDYEKMMAEIPQGFMMGVPTVPGYSYGSPEVKKEKENEENLEKPRVVQGQSPSQQGGLDIEAMAAEGFLGFAPKLAADKAFREDTIDFAEDNPLATLLLGPLVTGFKDGTKKVKTAEEPDYRRLSSGGWADLNFSKRTLEQNKKAREDNYKRIQKAMQAAQ
jgi:hypothetical protein